MKKKLLFLTLNTFSATGGIEKVCRVAAKALHEIADEAGSEAAVFSMYDGQNMADTRYIPAHSFKGFSGNRIKFVAAALKKGVKADTVILSHVNLLLAGWFIKLFSPKTQVVLIAHGIEVWESFSGRKQKMLKAVDLFLPVSRFTAQKLQDVHHIPANKIQVLNNCLDPFLEKNSMPAKETELKKKYGIADGDFVLFTLTRLKFSEQYKGYDKVVEAVAGLKESHPHIKYLVAGKYDADEKARLDKIIAENNMKDKVVFGGFIGDDEIAAHFNIADAYIMPSTGEGFGVVFIEALFYGKPVIAGNVDGSVDALGGGEFGILVNPSFSSEIRNAIVETNTNSHMYHPVKTKVEEAFSYLSYKRRLRKIVFKDGNLVRTVDNQLTPAAKIL